MRIEVDAERCQGHAMCVLKGPDIYELDDSGYNRMAVVEVRKGLEEQARRGAGACPERAIRILEDPAQASLRSPG